ncbi:MAG: hypothetical protein ACRERC_11025 [Candidatus Binatia bacterium]
MMRRLAVATGILTSLAASSAMAQPCPAPGNANAACTANCAEISVPNNLSVARGATVNVPISFKQGADDGESGKGNDEVAALAFTLGIPGSGSATPLVFDCTEGNLAAGSVTPAAAIADNFTVVIENAQCTNRNRCLCPGDGQTRDNFVNIVVYGPKSLPEEGPVEIPVLPDDGQIVQLTLRAAADAEAGDKALHVFAATDNGTPEKPQFAANLSIGDQAACDVTGDSSNVSRVAFVDGKVTITPGTTTVCVGDCNGNRAVSIGELISGVNIALGNADVSTCTAFDPNGNGVVSINELIAGVNNALNGCPAQG